MWLTLAIPPVAILLANFIIPFCGIESENATAFIVLVPLCVLFGLIPGLAFHFHDAVKHRYRGGSLGFLVFSYIFSEILVCIVLSVGSCFLISAHLNNS